MKYDFKTIEQKWQKAWEDAHAFQAKDDFSKPKFYGLIEFPYPSGAGMHVGHIKAYSGMEVICRKRRMQGYNVLFPIGFDAFGLLTENYGLKRSDFLLIGQEKLTQLMKNIINGLSGFSLSSLTTDLFSAIKRS